MNAQSPHPAAQTTYQVRFDWGRRGAARITEGVDILVWVDVLPEASASSLVEVVGFVPGHAAVLAAGLADASATARWILAEQERLGRRASLAIVAAGDAEAGFTADDLLGAGAVIDALAALGIDDTSPEAAVAASAFAGLRRAVRHLTSASASGRAAAAAGMSTAALHEAAALDARQEARVVRLGSGAGASAD
ncbi:hypothetical protein [Agromyces sp. Root81]|uniref:hypothetical protein n=1 Tax=Agromyces sp. Root81 TaxID=1736601 RepID=UPI0012F708C7|nr:hypothetical protein [Agromyces sp. Root81]